MKRFSLFLLLLAAFVSSCHEHEDEVKGSKASVWLDVDWSHFDKETVTGMSVYCYSRSGDACSVMKTNNITGMLLSLPAGTYDFVIMNQSEHEFGRIRFDGMDSFRTASALSETSAVSWQRELKTAYNPEWLVLGRCEGFVVTEQMTKMVKDSCVTTSGGATVASIINVRPENVTWKVSILAHVHNIDKVYAVRGIMSSLAGGVSMCDGDVTSFEPVYKSMEEWSRKLSGTIDGVVSYEFTSFGPSQIVRTLMDNELELSFLLVDSQTVSTFRYDIGQYMDVDEDARTITIILGASDIEPEPPGDHCNPEAPLLIPEDIKPGGSGSSYGVDVEDWGELIDLEIPV